MSKAVKLVLILTVIFIVILSMVAYAKVKVDDAKDAYCLEHYRQALADVDQVWFLRTSELTFIKGACEARLNHDYQQALTLLDEALRKNPDLAQVYYEKAYIYQRENNQALFELNNSKAIQICLDFIHNGANKPHLIVQNGDLKGMAKFVAGNTKSVRELIDGLQVESFLKSAYYQKAHDLKMHNQVNDAITVYTEVLSVDSTDNTALMARASLYRRIGEMSKAREDEQHANDAVSLRASRITKSVAQVVQDSPLAPLGVKRAAHDVSIAADVKASDKVRNNAMMRIMKTTGIGGPDGQEFFKNAQRLKNDKNLDAATREKLEKRNIDLRVRIFPQSAGERLTEQGRFRDAIPKLKDEITQDATQSQAHKCLAVCYLRTGDAVNAKKEMQIYISGDPVGKHKSAEVELQEYDLAVQRHLTNAGSIPMP